MDTFWVIDFDHISPDNPMGRKFTWVHNHKIQKLAIPFDAYQHEFMEVGNGRIGRFRVNMLKFLWKHGVRELIVVFEGEDAAHRPDVVLVTPITSLSKYFAKNGLEENASRTKDIDWESVEYRCHTPALNLLDMHTELLDEYTEVDTVEDEDAAWNQMVLEYSKKLWNPPSLSFKEAKSLKEMCRSPYM